MESKLHSVSFRAESAFYRQARNRLLQAELKLRQNLKDVAVMRRALPLGNEVPENYVFEEAALDLGNSLPMRRALMSELFQSGKDNLAVYSALHCAQSHAPCPMCISILHSLNDAMPYVTKRINLVVVAKSTPERIRTCALEHGWRNLRLLSCLGNTYSEDYQNATAEGDPTPSLNVFVSRHGRIHHFYNTELRLLSLGHGEAPRQIDLLWHLWNLSNYTPEWHSADWRPEPSDSSASAELKCA